jgi:putative transcription factor
MVQCEMCGTETSSPKTVKVEGAELQVCDQCAEFGTEVKTESTSSTSTKYSTSSSSSSSSSSSGGSTSSGGGGGSRRRSDMFDDMDEIAQDYDEKIRTARESRGLSQKELAQELNEKASLIRKLERSETLPSDEIQTKLERFLEIDLSGSGGADDSEWEADSSTGEYTLGDMVERKD